MKSSLHGAAARATTSSSGYVCLACRSKHHLRVRVASPLARSASSSSEPALQDDNSSSTRDGPTSVNAAYNAASKEAKRKLPRRIAVEGGKENGYIARTKFDGRTWESPPSDEAGVARSKVKSMIIEHINEQKAQGTVSEVSEDTEQAEKEKRSPSPRRLGLRGTVNTQRSGTIDDPNPVNIRRIPTDLSNAPAEGSPFTQLTGGEKTIIRVLKAHRGRTTRSRIRRIISRAQIREQSIRLLNRNSRLRTPTELLRLSLEGSRSEVLQEGAEESSEKGSSPIPRKRQSTPPYTPDLQASKNAQTIRPLSLQQVSLDVPTGEVPGLCYGLDRVLFNPGVYHVQDPRSRVYNFDPYLEKITDTRNFNFASLDEYRRPSADNTLSDVAEDHNLKYFSSTSNITPILQHLHFLLSGWRPLSFTNLSTGFFVDRPYGPEEGEFTQFSRSPQSIYLKPKQGGYAVDRAEEKAHTGLLSFVGQCLEKLFTVPKEVFESYLKESTAEKPEPTRGGYHYTKHDSILVRSQLDAHDSRLPGTGVFDIKTRAVLPIRMDSLETSQDVGKNYELKSLYGEYESFEREFFDMGRATMMKYSLQARLGRMDGIFVAYHNIMRLFGFQYLSISDMDKVLHGQADTTLGDGELSASLRILSDVFDHAVKKYPDEPIRLYFEARKGKRDLIVHVVPVTDAEIDQQREDAVRQSREYLERLNNPKEDNDGTNNVTKAENELSQGSLSEGTDSASFNTAREENSWLSSSEEPASATQEGDSKDPVVETVDVETIRDEASRLFDFASTIRREADVLIQAEKDDAPQPHEIHKMMLADIVQKTLRFEGDVAKLATTLDSCDPEMIANSEVDLKGLQNLAQDQSEANKRLFDQAQSQDVMKGTDITTFLRAQTIEAALKASAERDSLPPRFSVFKVQAQSRVDGKIVPVRPENVAKDTAWEVTYTIDDIDRLEDASTLFLLMLKKQRNASMANWESKRLRFYYESTYFKKLMSLSKDGMKWREERDRLDQDKQVVVFEPRG